MGKQMNVETREKIADLHDAGMSIRRIAMEVGRDKTTVQAYLNKRRDSVELEEYRKVKDELLRNGLIGDNVVEKAVKLRFEQSLLTPPPPPEEKPRYYNQVSPPGPGKKAVGRPKNNVVDNLNPADLAEKGINPQQDGQGEVQPTIPPAFPPDEAEAEYLRKIHWIVPPGAGGASLPKAFQNYNGVFKGGRNFYIPADQAIQQSRENSRSMLYNLIIREALQSRFLSVAESEWHIEPDDASDPKQVKMANELQKTIESIPDLLKLFVSLLKSRWYGIYGVQLCYKQDGMRKLYVTDWDELHGDSLVMDMATKEIGVYTINSGAPGVHKVELVPGYIGRVHVFENGDIIKVDVHGRPYKPLNYLKEREAVIIMKYDPAASDYLDPRNAGSVQGQGLRNNIFATWYVYQETLGNLHDWLSRIGSGVVLFKYKINNAQSYNQAVGMAESLDNQAAMLVPVDVMENGGKPVEGIEIVQASAIGLDNFLRVIDDFYGPQLRRMIVGQDSTSQETKAGLGSKIAEVHENSFSRLCKYDAVDLEQTLTTQLVQVIQKWNFPGTEDRKCKFVMDLAKPNVKEQIEAVKLLADLGVEFDGDELRKLIGFSKPKEGAVIVGGKQESPMGDMFGMPGEEKENPFGEKKNPFEDHKDMKDDGLEQMEKGLNTKKSEEE